VQRAGRDDLAERVLAARARARRTDAAVCVVGEFKQGKSSLINALLDEAVCPVDDDLATAVVTVVHHGEQPGAVVHRRVHGERRSDAMAPVAALAHVAEPRQADIERVDVALPNPVLARGLAVVDMPGWGGIDGGGTAAALAFVGTADAVLFVTDASAELSAPEVELLQDIRQRCPIVVACLTKVDLHPEWRRIAELDRGHLAAAGIDAPVMAVSADLLRAARSRGDDDLATASGVPALLDLLLGEVVPSARAGADQAAVDVATDALRSVNHIWQLELEALRARDAGAVDAAVADAQARADRTRGLGPRSTQVLNERMAQLATDAGFGFRAAMRDLAKLVDDQVEAASSAKAWDDVGRNLQREVSVAIERAFDTLAQGAHDAAAEIGALLELDVGAPDRGEQAAAELPELQAVGVQDARRRAVGAGLQAFDALRGAAGGVIVLSLLATTLPAASAVVLMSNPFTIGLGLFAGGRTLIEGRSRRIAQNRQKARAAMRQLLDDVQFAVGNELAGAARSVHLELRDRVTAAIERVQREAAEQTAAVARAREEGSAGAERVRALEGAIASLERLIAEGAA
jgi:hypothetical protein